MVTYHPQDTGLQAVMGEAAARGVRVVVKKGLASGRLSAPEAIGWILAQDCVASVVIGSLSLDHMKENLRAACESRPQWRPILADGRR
jgi:aryl-alcohol dehydrogenase-like predicted oxidoreductase